MKTKIILIAAIMFSVSFQVFSQQKIYISTDAQKIYTVNLTNCTSEFLGQSGVTLYDMAVTSDGKLWGIGAMTGYLYSINILNGAATFRGVTGFYGNALIELNDTMLLMSGGPNLYTVNVNTAIGTFIGSIGYISGGDLTWYDNDLYLVSSDEGILVKIKLNNTNTGIVSATPINDSTNQIPICFGAITASFPSIPNAIVGFKDQAAYRICPFDASYQIICDSIPSIAPDIIYSAASIRLSVQHPLPKNCDTLGLINEHPSPHGFEINPNPSTNEFEILNLDSEIYKAIIYDIIGKKVFQSQTINKESRTIINVSKLAVGIYLIQIQASDFIQTKKIVIAR